MPALPSASVSIMAPPNPHLRDNPLKLKEVDDQIESLRKLLKFMEDERRRLTAIPADAHPVGVPEVLGYIMEWGVHLDAFEPEKLLEVSRHWQHVALSTPGVWARIVRKPMYMDNYSQFLIRCKRYLERSKSHPLYIDVDFLYFYFESPSNAVYNQFAELIQPHLHRCYHISLANPRESLAYLFSSLSPNVEHIAHYCIDAAHKGPPISLPPALPKLQHLSGTFPLPFFAGIDMPALEHLQLALSPENPSFHDLLYILLRCPNLKSLLFDNVTFTLAVDPDLTSVLVPLSRLNRLDFHCFGAADAMLLTHHCDLPNIRELCIAGNMLPIPLGLFRNITTLHCSDWDFPWFIRALRVATQLTSLTVRSRGPDSPFHSELLPALSNNTIPSSSSLANITKSSQVSTWLIPRLKTLHLAALNFTDFPMEGFLTLVRKRASSSTAQTIEKLVFEDVTHLTDFNLEQLKAEVEHVEVVKTTTPPITFPLFPTAIGGGAAGVEGDPPAAMHPIILPTVAYGAPIITPPPIDGDDAGGDPAARLILGPRDVSPRRRRRSRSISRESSSNLHRHEQIPRPRSRSRSTSSPSPRSHRGRSWERPVAWANNILPPQLAARIAQDVRFHTDSSSAPSSSQPTNRSRSPSVRPLFTGRSRSPRAATFVLESGVSRSSRSGSPPERLRTVEGSPISSSPRVTTLSSRRPSVPRINTNATGHSQGRRSAGRTRRRGDFEEPNAFLHMPQELLPQSAIIVRSPDTASPFSQPDVQRGRSSRMDNADGSETSHRRRSLLPSMSSARSSSTVQSSETSGTGSRTRSPYPFEHAEDGQQTIEMNLNIFGPAPHPRQLQATVSASTDSTLPMGRGHMAFLTQGMREPMARRASTPITSSPATARGLFTHSSPTSSMRARGKGARRSLGGHANDLRLFVPVHMPNSPGGPQHSVTLPPRRQFYDVAVDPLHEPPTPNTVGRETQRTSITVHASPSLNDTQLVSKDDPQPRRRSSIWSKLKNLIK